MDKKKINESNFLIIQGINSQQITNNNTKLLKIEGLTRQKNHLIHVRLLIANYEQNE